MTRILHITDTHFGITEDAEDEIHGFARKVADLTKQFRVDICLHTGDVLNRPSSEVAYRVYADCRVPCLHVPGNHDNSEMMRDFFPEMATGFPYVVETGSFRIIGLDSSSGKLGAVQIEALRNLLSEGSPGILLIHHQFLPFEDSWLNPYILEDAEDFIRILREHQDVILAVFHGHFHAPLLSAVGTVPVFGGPSAAYQFDPTASCKTISSQKGEVSLVGVEEQEVRLIERITVDASLGNARANRPANRRI